MPKDYTGVIFNYRIRNLSKREDQYYGRIPFKRFLKEMKPDKLLAFYQPENPDFIKCAALYFEKRDNTITFKTSDDEYVYVSYEKFSETSIVYLTGKYGEITEKKGLCDRLYKNRKKYLNSLPVNEPSIDPVPVTKKKVYEPEISKKEYTSILDIPFDDAAVNISLFPYIEYHYSHRKHIFDKNGEVHSFAFFKNGIYKVVYLNVFYCKKCNMYFDVKQSFLAQLKSLDIKPEDMIVSYKDEKR